MWQRKLGSSAAIVAIVAALALTAPVAAACGWWGDGDTDGDDEAIVVSPDGASETSWEPSNGIEMARLSAAYRHGDGVPRDPVLARWWAQRAAEAGHAGAMNDLGQMLEDGFGWSKDEVVAAYWYRRAARHGVAPAQHSLAMMLRDGRGVERGLVAAERWLRSAASLGHGAAGAELAGMIWDGTLVARAPDEACLWWLVALRRGHAGSPGRCRQAQPTLSDGAFRALEARAVAWQPHKTETGQD